MPLMSDYISQDSLLQILRWLPVKSLLRFRCVSKWMKETIDSDSFMMDHISLQKPRLIAQLGLKSNEREFILLDPKLPLLDSRRDPIPSEQIYMLGSLHGVVCLYGLNIGLRLWNPATCKFSSRPLPKVKMLENFFCYSGFWIDPSSKEFKVITLRLPVFDIKPMEAMLYKSVEEGWIKLRVRKHIKKCRSQCNGRCEYVGPVVMVGGLAHWVCHYESDEGAETSELVEIILVFDFVQERFDLIQMPKIIPVPYYELLCNWKGSLSYVYMEEELNQVEVECKLCSRQEGSWINMFSFNLTSSINEVFCVLGGMEEGGKILAAADSELVLYDTRSGVILSKEIDWYSSHFLIAYDFVDSLLFP